MSNQDVPVVRLATSKQSEMSNQESARRAQVHVNASLLAYKSLTAATGTPLEQLEDDILADKEQKVAIEVYKLSHAAPPVTITTQQELQQETVAWTAHNKHWINIRPSLTSTLGLAQAMIILKETLQLPPFSVIDSLEGGCRVRLDQADGCLYTTLVTFFCTGQQQQATTCALQDHLSSGTLADLHQIMMSASPSVTPPAISRVAQQYCPAWDRVCLFLTQTTCLSIWGSNRHSIPQAVAHWWEPESIQDHALDRHQGPDYVYYKLLEGCMDAPRPVINCFHEQLNRFEDGIFAAKRAALRRDVDQTVQLHLIARELAIMKHHMTPTERVLKQLLKVPAFKSPSNNLLPDQQLNQLVKDAHLEHALSIKHDDVVVTPRKSRVLDIHTDAVLSSNTIDFLEEVRDDCIARQAEIDMLVAAAQDLTGLLFNLTSYRSTVSCQTLAGVSVIFLPLSWWCGIYGTNFILFPELQWGVDEPDVPDGWAAGYMYFWIMMAFMALVCTTILRLVRIF